jgi:integrase
MHFAMHWKPLRDKPIEAIKRAEAAARLQELVQQNGRVAAARARGNLSALFTWAMKEGLCDANPVIGTNDPSAGIKPRERVLADDEIRAIWNACREDNSGRIVKLLLLTGCRREEIGALTWDEFDLDTGMLNIPGSRTKNGRELSLPLSSLALDILRSTPRREGRKFVFGRFSGPFSGWHMLLLSLTIRITQAEGKPLAHWTLHDLRRTMRTGLSRLGVAPHVAELAINHAKIGIQSVYDRHQYQPEIGRALALWGEHIASIVEGRRSAVTPLRGRA